MADNQPQHAEKGLRNALGDAYDAIAHALNYHQEDHVWRHLEQAKTTIVDALHAELLNTGPGSEQWERECEEFGCHEGVAE